MKKDLGKIKVIFFDVGSTLVDEIPVHISRFVKAQPAIEEATGRRPEIIEFVAKLYELGRTEYKIVYPSLYALGCPQGVKYPYDSDYEVIYPNVRNGFCELSKKYRIGIIANQRPQLADRLDNFGLLQYIDQSILFGSEDVGMEKPDSGLFTSALKAAGVEPYEAIMVGDRPDNDIYPANMLGMCTARIHSGPNGELVDEREEAQPDLDCVDFADFVRQMMDL